MHHKMWHSISNTDRPAKNYTMGETTVTLQDGKEKRHEMEKLKTGQLEYTQEEDNMLTHKHVSNFKDFFANIFIE